MYELKLNQELSDVFSVSPLYDLHINDIINQYLQVRQCIICSNTGEIINRCNACDTCFVCDECFDRYVFEYSSCGSCGSILDTEILLLCREIRYYLKGPFQSTASNDSRVINLTNRCTDLLNANRPNPINKQIINCYQSAINRENRSRTVNLRCVRGALLSSICVLSLTLSLLFIGIP